MGSWGALGGVPIGISEARVVLHAGIVGLVLHDRILWQVQELLHRIPANEPYVRSVFKERRRVLLMTVKTIHTREGTHGAGTT